MLGDPPTACDAKFSENSIQLDSIFITARSGTARHGERYTANTSTTYETGPRTNH